MMSQLNKGKSADQLLAENKAMTPERSRDLRETNRERTFKRRAALVAFIEETWKSNMLDHHFKPPAGRDVVWEKLWLKYCNDELLIKAFNYFFTTGKESSKLVIRHIRNINKSTERQPFVLLLFGHKGTGKGKAGRKLVRIYAKIINSNIRWHFWVSDYGIINEEIIIPGVDDWFDVYFCYSYDTAAKAKAILKDQPGGICFIDDIETMHDKGSRIAKDNYEAGAETSDRALDINTIVTYTKLKDIPQTDEILETVSWNDDDGKQETLLVRYLNVDGKNIPRDIVIFDVSEPEEIEAAYKDASKYEKKALAGRGGKTRASTELVDPAVEIVCKALEGASASKRNEALNPKGSRGGTKGVEYFISESVPEAREQTWGDAFIKQVSFHVCNRFKCKDDDKDDDTPAPKPRKDDSRSTLPKPEIVMKTDPGEKLDDGTITREKFIDILDNGGFILNKKPVIVNKDGSTNVIGSDFNPELAERMKSMLGDHFNAGDKPFSRDDLIQWFDKSSIKKPAEANAEIVEKPSKICFDENAEIEKMLRDDPDKWTKYVKAFKRWNHGRGETQDAIAVDLLEKTTNIQYWCNAVKGELANRKGDTYEPTYREVLLNDARYTDIKYAGGTGAKGHGKFDYMRTRVSDGIIEVVQYKCYNTNPIARSGINISIKKFLAERKIVKDLRKKGIKAVLIGHVFFYENESFDEVEINVDHPPKTVHFRVK